MSATVEVTEFTDPGCIWSWSSEPTLRWLRRRYGSQITWRRVFGIQIDDIALTHPDRDPDADAERFREDWLDVSVHTGAPVCTRLAWMHRSTVPASAAALAAQEQGDVVAEAVLRRLREAVFVDGRPADTPDRIVAALAGVDGLDIVRLVRRAEEPDVRAVIDEHFSLTRDPHPDVLGRTGPGPNNGAARPHGDHVRYGFPTLIARGPGGERVLSGWRSPEAHARDLEAVAAGTLVADTSLLDAAEALRRYRSLTAVELDLLTGGGQPPEGAVRVETATTAVWLHPAEADARGGVSAGART
ncbi:MAG: DsbA family protein [Thermoleophilia bacterium]